MQDEILQNNQDSEVIPAQKPQEEVESSEVDSTEEHRNSNEDEVTEVTEVTEQTLEEEKQEEITHTPPAPNLEEQITQSLADNAHWIEQVRLSLLVNGELYKKFLIIEESYNKSLKVLTDFEQSTREKRGEVIAIFSDFQKQSAQFSQEFHSIFENVKLLSAQSLEHTNTILSALKDMQNVKDDVHTKVIELYALRDNITKLQSQLQDLELIKQEVQTLYSTIVALKGDLQSKIVQWTNDIHTLTSTNKSELLTLVETLKDTLNTHKDTLESEMTTHKEQGLSELENKITQASAEYARIEQSFIDKQNNINQANDELSAGRAELEKQLAQAQADITTQKTTALSDISGALQVSKEALTQTLQTKTDEGKNTLEGEKNKHIQSLIHQTTLSKQDMQAIKDSYLDEIHNDLPAQVADLTQLCMEIKASNQALGTDFVSKTYTSNTTFTPISGITHYYVFLRGGTGGTNSSTRGSTSSFGSLLSCTGGAGNPNGAGQVGESKGAFLQVSDNQNINIASGGICIVSYATKQ